MAITKPPVLPSWAEAGDKVQPSNAEIQAGWPLSSIPPSRQRFNWLLNFLANGVRYFSRRGLPDYDAAETYMTGDRIIGDDGKTYRSLIDNNTAQTPSTSPTKWEEWAPTLSRFAALIQGQTYTAFTTAGAAPNFTLTPSPAIAAYAAGQRFRVKFHAAGTGADVLNVSALGNKSLKQYDNSGAKVAAVIAANQLVDIEYDGTEMVLLDPLPNQVFRNLAVITATGNWTVPAGVSSIDVELWGGGGGGGGSGSGGGTSGGGGAGGYARGIFAVTPGQVIACTIGAAGTGGGAGGAGSGGGTTSFGAMLSATGGGGGQPNPSGNSGSGGTGTGGTINVTSASGSTGAASNVQGGAGATAAFGGGGGGGAQGAAGAGAIPGGGGGGGGSSSPGGAGARGQIHVRY